MTARMKMRSSSTPAHPTRIRGHKIQPRKSSRRLHTPHHRVGAGRGVRPQALICICICIMWGSKEGGGCMDARGCSEYDVNEAKKAIKGAFGECDGVTSAGGTVVADYSFILCKVLFVQISRHQKQITHFNPTNARMCLGAASVTLTTSSACQAAQPLHRAPMAAFKGPAIGRRATLREHTCDAQGGEERGERTEGGGGGREAWHDGGDS